jgi:hypothetical protein
MSEELLSSWENYKKNGTLKEKQEIRKETIFISIAAYNEEDLEQTLDSALKNAYDSDRIYFGVYCHKSDSSHTDIKCPNMKVIYVTYPNVLGVGLSRVNSASLYNGEDYFFQIDAHMLFEKTGTKKQ